MATMTWTAEPGDTDSWHKTGALYLDGGVAFVRNTMADAAGVRLPSMAPLPLPIRKSLPAPPSSASRWRGRLGRRPAQLELRTSWAPIDRQPARS